MSIIVQHISETVCRITLNRPERCNAISSEMLRRLFEQFEELRQSGKCRVLILGGAGDCFCSGLDLAEAILDDSNAFRMTQQITQLLIMLTRIPVIVIAEVNGACCGGGAAAAFASDLIIASTSASFMFPDTHRGLEPTLLFPLLRRKIPLPILRQMILTGGALKASDAKNFGLVYDCVESDKLLTATTKLTEQICRGERSVVQQTKTMLAAHENTLFTPDLTTEFNAALESHTNTWKTKAAREGVKAFLEKRDAEWLE
ncbi:MAG: enoyl-CoA hydratase/isomerase family protein [Planctomycetaceae bacterium]|jgi:methylglutaconyl-CoA hydratase|nr:enoyl-CoA hydratase/isomerase family protein [Planctomycetaceae bacterium]